MVSEGMCVGNGWDSYLVLGVVYYTIIKIPFMPFCCHHDSYTGLAIYPVYDIAEL